MRRHLQCGYAHKTFVVRAQKFIKLVVFANLNACVCMYAYVYACVNTRKMKHALFLSVFMRACVYSVSMCDFSGGEPIFFVYVCMHA